MTLDLNFIHSMIYNSDDDDDNMSMTKQTFSAKLKLIEDPIFSSIFPSFSLIGQL